MKLNPPTDVRQTPSAKQAKSSHMNDCCMLWSYILLQHWMTLFKKSAEAFCRPSTFNIPVSAATISFRLASHILTGIGHSLTIVGFEKRRNGTRNLLVFDPMFKPSPGIQRLIGTNFKAAGPERLLKAYRRGETYLGRYKNFELLK